MKEKIGIYIHIPFCKSKCYYCDFVSYCNMDEFIDDYIQALCNEILQNSEILSSYQISTVYFGGGTPSYIPSKYITRIMDTLKLFVNDEYMFDEVTIEVNPNSVDYNKLKEYKKACINRISVGLQSTHDTVLKNIGRAHVFKDFLDTMDFIKKVGFNNVSVDLIYPLPGLNVKLLDDTLNKVIDMSDKYSIKHISIYNLEIHEDGKLKFLLENGFLKLPDEDEEYIMKEHINSILEKNMYYKYEISNFAKNGFESKHNLNYWTQGSYLGFGVNASSFFLGTRYTNVSKIDSYIEMAKNFNVIAKQKEELNKLDLMKEYMILNLRLSSGVNINKFKKKFDVDVYSLFGSELKELCDLNLLVLKNDDTFVLTKRGTEVANIVWEKFI